MGTKSPRPVLKWYDSRLPLRVVLRSGICISGCLVSHHGFSCLEEVLYRVILLHHLSLRDVRQTP